MYLQVGGAGEGVEHTAGEKEITQMLKEGGSAKRGSQPSGRRERERME